ncbi:Vegetative incompatibility protein HET-E-1 [Fusarium culmorum]|uniref:Vegetative incompatibility protein HET-E-1 n=1 Tax=Fusarium culmorum TaxID=5516 RepID=A0A2T4GQV2_FUSCU|nr:Vegetative incompatibility protein HET-E-1 [Fusarium culmorum]
MLTQFLSQRLEQEAKSKLRDLLLDPKDALDHIQHPANSFIRNIFDWAEDGESPTICWLPGLAGTGKSTVSRTVARDLKDQCLGGCFFFKKGAGNRANGRTIFSIIAYQLALNFPPVRQHVIDVIQEDPASVMGSMNDQWRTLIREPLDKVEDREFARNVVLVIDALDECDKNDRQSILTILTTCPDTLKVFITSRPEFDIEAYFARKKQFHREISLHRVKTVDIESDITMFLRHRISTIVTEHNACYPQKDLRLEQDWPGSERFQILTKRSVPLFIAAATFIRMIENISWAESPNTKLNMIIETSNRISSAYEAIYKPVLSLISNGTPDEARVKARDSFIHIIGSLILLANPLSMSSLASLLDIDVRDVAGLVNPLRSVLEIPRDGGTINLFHLSFRDFLLGKSAGDLQVDEATTHAKLSSRCLEHLERKLRPDICDLESPGRSRFDIDQDTFNRKIPQETQYACLYWVHHLIGSGKQLQDGDEEHRFLKGFFLNWIEVLCLTGRFFESPNMLQQLLKIVNKKSGSKIFKFVQDAIRFIHFFRDGIEETPLQLYHSGIVFSPSSSIVPEPFEDRHCPNSVTRLPTVDSNWPQSVQAFEVGVGDLIIQLTFLSNDIIITWGFHADVKIWDISSGSCLQTLKDWKDIRTSEFALGPAIGWFLEGSLLAIGAKGRIDIWNFESHSLITCLFLEESSIFHIAFSNDGMSLCSISKVATESSERVLHIHNLDSRECTNKVQIRNGNGAIYLSTKGQWLACVAGNCIWLSAWDTLNGLDWVVNLGPHYNEDRLIRFSSDGSLMAMTSIERRVRIWRTGTEQCIWSLQYPYTGRIDGLCLTKDWLAAYSYRQQTVVFDLKTGKISHEMGKIANGSIAISADAKLLATVSEGNTVRVWNLSPMQSTHVGIFHLNLVEFLTVASDESTVVSACRYQVKTWDITSGQCIVTLGESYLMTFRAATENGSYCVMSSGHNIEVWSLDSWQQVKFLQREEGSFKPSDQPWAISENGEVLAIPVWQFQHHKIIQKIEIWDVHHGLLRQVLDSSPPMNPKVAFSPDGSIFAHTTVDSIEIRQNSESCKLLMRIEDYGMDLLTSLSFHGQKLVTIAMGGYITAWDTETGKLFTSYQMSRSWLAKSFINHDVLLGHVGPDVHLRQDFLKELQVSDDKCWIMRGGERVLWLPSDYRPHSKRYFSGLPVYALGSMIVIGTWSGRVFNLCIHIEIQVNGDVTWKQPSAQIVSDAVEQYTDRLGYWGNAGNAYLEK